MFIFPCTRSALLDFLPPGSVAAEVGVAQGDFSTEILARSKPARLHLIDAWLHQSRADLATDPNNPAQVEQDLRHSQVLTRFKSEINAGRVQVHRGLSHEVAADLPDGCLDWLYIDGDHSYAAVSSDLESYLPKLKPDGLILGHDYTWHGEIKFGVVEAVNEFAVRRGFDVLAINSADNFPTYVLGHADSPMAYKFIGKAAFSMRCVVELEDYPRRYEFRQRIASSGGKRRGYLSFSPTRGGQGC